MRLRHPDGTVVHLAYCTNVHPAEDLEGVFGQLARFAEPVRERLGVDRLGLGLWLARDVATALRADPDALARLRAELEARALEVVTLNGFPYRGFQKPVVKHAVYRPDWTEPERLRYTVDLAWILAALLPDGAARGSISTLPLAWREPWTDDRRDRARRALDELAAALGAVADATGRPIRVGFEPEPGCLVETTADAVARLGGVDPARLGVALDACHLAVAFEEPGAAVARLVAAGLPIVKLQAAVALVVPDPADPVARAALGAFAEPRFLHQTREDAAAGLLRSDDLAAALGGPDALPARDPWRIHFHMPLHAAPPAPLASSRPVLEATLATLFGGRRALTDHVEVETYTWPVMPGAGDDGDLVAGLAAELVWARGALLATGLTAPTGVPA